MAFIPRDLSAPLKKAAGAFPVLLLTGPRRSGKTMLLRHLFPKADYVLLENPGLVARARQDPDGFLQNLRRPAVLDEIQHAPELNAYIRDLVDRAPRRMGQWILTGSQEAPLMQGVTESLAGRAAVFQLMPLSFRERRRWDMLTGGFPEVVQRPGQSAVWFSSYLQTYLERDVRSLLSVRDLPTFRRFLSLLATRHGQTLNKTYLAAPLGVSIPTIGHWLNVLEITGHILVVPPFYRNFSKRLVKSPKIYWIDPGLTCFLLGLETRRQLELSPFLGALFEGFIASEIVKNQTQRGRRKELYYFRDERGLEVDFVVPSPGGALTLVEAKATHTPQPSLAAGLTNLLNAAHKELKGHVVQGVLVYRRGDASPRTQALAPGIKALSVEEFLLDPAYS